VGWSRSFAAPEMEIVLQKCASRIFAKQSPQDERRRREQALVPEIKYVLNKVQ
jgi:hypothetical protein